MAGQVRESPEVYRFNRCNRDLFCYCLPLNRPTIYGSFLCPDPTSISVSHCGSNLREQCCCVRHNFLSQLFAMQATAATSSKITMHFFILQLKDSNSIFSFIETIYKPMQAFGTNFHVQDQIPWAIFEFCFRTFESELSSSDMTF